MSERPTSSFIVPLLIAATVLSLGFGGGVFWGLRTRKHRPKTPNASAELMTDAEVKSELAACKRELSAAKKAQAKEQVTAILKEMDDAGLEGIAKVEALQKEVHECQVRETLQNAYVCGTIREHDNMYMILVHGMSCADPPGIGEYLLNSVDKCTAFAGLEGYPAHLDEDDLTEQEKGRIIWSKWSWKVTKAGKAWGLEHTRRECRRIWALPEE